VHVGQLLTPLLLMMSQQAPSATTRFMSVVLKGVIAQQFHQSPTLLLLLLLLPLLLQQAPSAATQAMSAMLESVTAHQLLTLLLLLLPLLLLLQQAPSATTRSMSAVLKGVIAQQGVAGLWSGATPSVLRLIMLNSSMVATYDEVRACVTNMCYYYITCCHMCVVIGCGVAPRLQFCG
jgi:hypothetical protein